MQYKGCIGRYIAQLLNECDHLQKIYLVSCDIDDNDTIEIAIALVLISSRFGHFNDNFSFKTRSIDSSNTLTFIVK